MNADCYHLHSLHYHFVLLIVTKNVEFATFTQTVMILSLIHISEPTRPY